jgi:NAD(P)-dependent dehydrogenase (short-subunit alcohol dehydrogenase family)
VDLDLDGKVAVVTGAGKGIGLAVTQALAAEGARVVAGSRSTGSLDGLKGVTPVAVDLSAVDGPAQLIQRATEEHIGGFATGRFTTPEEVATLITFLASSRAGNITGVNYIIDGGLIKTT